MEKPPLYPASNKIIFIKCLLLIGILTFLSLMISQRMHKNRVINKNNWHPKNSPIFENWQTEVANFLETPTISHIGQKMKSYFSIEKEKKPHLTIEILQNKPKELLD